MLVYVLYALGLAAAFVAGLLVGRKNPGIANSVARVVKEAKAVKGPDPKAEVAKVVAAARSVLGGGHGA